MSCVDSLYAREGQRLIDHLRDVGNMCPYKYLGYLHDIGKVSKKFQDKLKGVQKNRFRHPAAGLPIYDYLLTVSSSEEPDKNKLYLAAMYYHHTPISFDMIQNDILTLTYGKPEEKEERFLMTKEEIKCAFEMLNEVLPDEDLKSKVSYEGFVDYLQANDDNIEEKYLKKVEDILRLLYDELNDINEEEKTEFAKMYHSLVEADWKSSGESQDNLVAWDTLIDRFIDRFQKKIGDWNDVQNTIKDNHLSDDKLLLTAPTGSGKTEASLLWALNKAKEKKAKRIIYVLPIRALIDDIFKRFKKYLEEDPNNPKIVDIWYSDYIVRMEKDLLGYIGSGVIDNFDKFNFYLIFRKYFMDRNIIITTADQVLMSYLNVDRYPIRYGLFKDSVFVFDEVQTYPEVMRALLYRFMKNVPEAVMVMTATPPKDNELRKLNVIVGEDKIGEWLEEFHGNKDVEIHLKKVEIPHSSKYDKREDKLFEEILNILNNELEDAKSVLIVMNTVNRAIGMFKKINAKNPSLNAILLHSRMIERDRESRLKTIEETLGKDRNEKLVVVSTQVIEAGVDLSFDCGIRELAPIDSLVQTLGRVNRDGESDKSRYYVIYTENHGDVLRVPYNKSEMIEVEEKIKEIKDNKEFLDRVEFERMSVNAGKKVDETTESYVDYVVNRANEYIWSVGSVEDLLGENLRDEIGKLVFVIPTEDESKENVINQLKEIRNKLQMENDKNEFKKLLKKYIKLICNFRGRFITSVSKEVKDEITEEEYKKKYLGVS